MKGNVDLSPLSVVDARLPGLVCAPTGIGSTLRVGTDTVCTGTYITLQSDINAGRPIGNTATASAPQTAPVSATATVNVRQNAMLSASKTVNLASVNVSGTVLRYSITIENVGSVDLTNLQVSGKQKKKFVFVFVFKFFLFQRSSYQQQLDLLPCRDWRCSHCSNSQNDLYHVVHCDSGGH